MLGHREQPYYLLTNTEDLPVISSSYDKLDRTEGY